ncbi:hypothetical protein [Halarcobacter sp.]|uniref:hypothetical protein n=1 Tax=Halarcobacter sp. TaxID=2321133 RepID=UPI0029F5BB2E|nr:hypothetical protein [Halarcobacter sp.]
MEEIFKIDFNNLIKPLINILEKDIKKAENKLFVFTSILILFNILIYVFIDKYNLHISFLLLSIFTSSIMFIVAKYTFRYEYKDIIDTQIFPKILKIFNNDATFFNYITLKDDAIKSTFFNIYEYMVISQLIQNIWSFKTKIKGKEIIFSSISLNNTNINTPISYTNRKGLFIKVSNINFPVETYIYENSFLSFKSFSNAFNNRFHKIEYEKHLLIRQFNNQDYQNTILNIIDILDKNISLSFIENDLYIFISQEFNCFNSNYFVNGLIPEYYNYNTLIKVYKLINNILSIIENKTK